MLVDMYAAQRLNDQEADRQSHYRSIAEYWRDDARALPASRWAIVRLLKRLFPGRAIVQQAAASAQAATESANETAQAGPESASETQRHAVTVEGAVGSEAREPEEHVAPRELVRSR
jgi:hypothetical protein